MFPSVYLLEIMEDSYSYYFVGVPASAAAADVVTVVAATDAAAGINTIYSLIK